MRCDQLFSLCTYQLKRFLPAETHKSRCVCGNQDEWEMLKILFSWFTSKTTSFAYLHDETAASGGIALLPCNCRPHIGQDRDSTARFQSLRHLINLVFTKLAQECMRISVRDIFCTNNTDWFVRISVNNFSSFLFFILQHQEVCVT